ncbi:MAG: manganese efflux pump MntP family protein [Bacteroidales bacterium]|jgi:putative Mn2+ efflux pump MntP|nr:manganese efflux pump MntP family protein [Bacteroidales bacterium]
MGLFFIILLAIGLSFDTFAVSVSSGLVMKRITFFNATKIAFSLAVFQAGLPILGWFLGSEFKEYLAIYDHWIAFILLAILGLKMIYESITATETEMRFNPLNFWMLMGLSLATSIDALVVGFSFAFIEIHILLAAFIIGIITFIASMLGILLGKKTGSKFGKQMELVGGLILIALGTKILIEHLGLL